MSKRGVERTYKKLDLPDDMLVSFCPGEKIDPFEPQMLPPKNVKKDGKGNRKNKIGRR